MDRDALGAIEAARIATRPAPRAPEGAGRGEHLHAVVAGVGHQDVARRAHGHPLGRVELAGPRPRAADDLRRQPTRGRKALEAAVGGVGNV